MISTHVRRAALPRGGLLLTEFVPDVRSVAVGVWVRTGSRDESTDLLGVAHFLEHMMFKGTGRRDAREIAKTLDGVGGLHEAYTTREYTCYFARVLDEQLELAFDVLGDCLSHSLFEAEQIELEKQVVCEEIRSYDDAPEELAAERLAEVVWRGHPLGTPILGTPGTVSSFTSDLLERRFATTYPADRTVVAAAGHVNHEHLLELCRRHLVLPEPLGEERPLAASLAYEPQNVAVERDLAQLTVALGAPGLAYTDPRRPAFEIMNMALGGSMSSRLFQRVREEEGLAYSVYTDTDACHDTGLFMCSLGVQPHRGRRALAVIGEEFARLRDGGVSDDELELMKCQWRGQVLLGLESTSERAARLARNELYWGRDRSIAESLQRIEAVSRDDLIEVARQVLDPARFSVVAVGPLPEGELGRQHLIP